MTISIKSNGKSQENSSLTRVRPYFRETFCQDHTGSIWLPQLLSIVHNNQDYAHHLSSLNCMIFSELLGKRIYSDKIIKKISLEKCFEYSLPPTRIFLQWLIEHHDKLTWPRHGRKERQYGDSTQAHRENLLGRNGKTKQIDARNTALNLLSENGTLGSKRKWWAFEGFTEVDCLLETDDFLLGIEGKRTEKVSPATHWYPKRNQIIRNLEVLKEKAGTKEYAILLMNEDGKDPITDTYVVNSLPHYSEQEIAEIKKHYLGAVSWRQACKAVGLDYNALPVTIRDVSAR
jgi:hypothetical protein